MRTALDSNVLLDVLLPDPTHKERSLAAIENAVALGSLIINEVVMAEVGGQFASVEAAMTALTKGSVEFVPSTAQSAHAAGMAWREYRRRGGRRDRVIADFLVAAHALFQADRLLTRDRGYYASYFPALKVSAP